MRVLSGTRTFQRLRTAKTRRFFPRTMSTSAPADWSATQYLKFGSERGLALHDLIARISLSSPKRITDLGCGPGNSTALLKARWPDARLSGVDSSPNMLVRARESLPGVDFAQGDVRSWIPDEPTDLLFANAVYHWLRSPERIPTILRLFETLPAGGVLALQVPDNYHEPSHAAMREVATATGEKWTEAFKDVAERPDLDPIEPPAEWYDALSSRAQKVDIWRTTYYHVLAGHRDIVEWVRGTGLQPFLNALPDGEVKEGYLKGYEKRLEQVYPKMKDGKVLLGYPRLFVVAVKA
jgi:trans-aconitate 2-methyltransferase